MLKTIKALCCVSLVPACVATPPTPLSDSEIWSETYWQQVAQLCIQKGWTASPLNAQNLASTKAAYVDARTDPARARAYRQRAMQELSGNQMPIEKCREMDAGAAQLAQHRDLQRQQQYQYQYQSALQSAASLNGQAMQSNAYNSIPRTTTCSHYQWGNVTFCN